MSRGVAWWLGAVVAAVTPAGGCLAIVSVIPTGRSADHGEGGLEIEIGGRTTMFTPDWCYDGEHEEWIGATLLHDTWRLDVVTYDKATTAYLRGGELPHELELSAEHCSRREITEDTEYDGEDSDGYPSGKVDVICVFDQARIRGTIKFHRCR